jgi:hypothetical protein
MGMIDRYTATAVIKMLNSTDNQPQAYDAAIVLSNFK